MKRLTNEENCQMARENPNRLTTSEIFAIMDENMRKKPKPRKRKA
jgi:hypothetical protein